MPLTAVRAFTQVAGHTNTASATSKNFSQRCL